MIRAADFLHVTALPVEISAAHRVSFGALGRSTPLLWSVPAAGQMAIVPLDSCRAAGPALSVSFPFSRKEEL